jgi:hypothetical protein
MRHEIITHAPNVHEAQYYFEVGELNRKVRIAMLSDIHWDNPKCDWELLKKDLEYCKANNIRIHINGDFFCMMQGRGDFRGNKADIRPEHNTATYLQSVVTTAVEWWKPYAHLIDVIGYGNHETGIIKFKEYDPLQGFIDLLNHEAKSNVKKGGYGGWYIIRMQAGVSRSKACSFKIKYFHGSGGGGVVTRGEINLSRALMAFEGMDCFTMGHVHENKETWVARDVINNLNKVSHKPILLMNTGTYKEEYGDGSKGWHVERGAPPKPVGGRILELNLTLKHAGDCFINSKSYRF